MNIARDIKLKQIDWIPNLLESAISRELIRGGVLYNGIISFYFPDKYTEWDKFCNAIFLANFFPTKVTISSNGKNDYTTFENSEAAFQALKYWQYRHEFTGITGTNAYLKTQELKDRGIKEDFTYAGYGSNFNGMYQVLKNKFFPRSELALRLQATNNSFLFEHRLPVGRDTYWCDGYDGKGRNILGLVLMSIRDELNGGPSYWTKFMNENLVPLAHDARIDYQSEWQQLVMVARNITERHISEQYNQLKQNIGSTSLLSQKRIPLQNITNQDIYIKCQRINNTLDYQEKEYKNIYFIKQIYPTRDSSRDKFGIEFTFPLKFEYIEFLKQKFNFINIYHGKEHIIYIKS